MAAASPRRTATDAHGRPITPSAASDITAPSAFADGSTTNADEDTNAAATTVFFSRDQSSVPNGGEFDDIVVWIPPYVLFNRMIAAGRLP